DDGGATGPARHESVGWTTVTPAPGVKATIGRSDPPDYNDPQTWPWHPGWSHIEFRGPNLTLDHLNFAEYHFDALGGLGRSQAVWFNGCTRTISCLPVTVQGRTSPAYNTYW